jgi:hypothetical protein
MPFFERAQNFFIPNGVLTDVARDYNNSHSIATSNTGIVMEGSNSGRGGDGASNINVHNIHIGNQDGQGGSDPPVCFYFLSSSRLAYAYSIDHASRRPGYYGS